MFTSRSFSSRAITPAESKYWTAYKSAADGRRQTVLMDMSHVPAADLDFSVLFPVVFVIISRFLGLFFPTNHPGWLSSLKDLACVTDAEMPGAKIQVPIEWRALERGEKVT